MSTARWRGSAPAVTAATRAPRLQPTSPMRFGSTCGRPTRRSTARRTAITSAAKIRRSRASDCAGVRPLGGGAGAARRQGERHPDRAPPGRPHRRQQEPLAALARAVEKDHRRDPPLSGRQARYADRRRDGVGDIGTAIGRPLPRRVRSEGRDASYGTATGFAAPTGASRRRNRRRRRGERYRSRSTS